MEQRQSLAQSPDIKAVRVRIDHWRQTRSKRTHMPEALWQASVALAKRHGAWRISQALGVRFEGLKSRLDRPAAQREPHNKASSFVDVTSVLGRARSEAAAAATVELSRADGATLSLRFADTTNLDLPSLIRTFCEAIR